MSGLPPQTRRPSDQSADRARGGQTLEPRVLARNEQSRMALLMVATMSATIRSFLLPFGHHFRARNWRVDAMASGCRDDSAVVDAYDHTWDMDWTRNPRDPHNLTRAVKAVRQIVVREGYDIVHVHTPVAAFVTRLALRKIRLQGKPKVVYTAHGFHFHRQGTPIRNMVFRILERIAGCWTDFLIVINREDADAARRHRILPIERIGHMPGIGVDLQEYDSTAASAGQVANLRDELGLAPESPLFALVAEFIPRKRHRDALLALQALRRTDAHLALAGDGPLRSEIEALASRLGLRQRVHFLGFRRDVAVLMRAAVATLLPSEQEGLPRSVLESMCLETPVIGSRIRGTEELLEDGCGYLYEVGDTQTLAERMAWVVEHPEQSRSTAQRARRRTHDYDVRRILQLHEALYQRLLTGHATD